MKKAWYKKWWIWVLAIVVLAIIGTIIGGGGNDNSETVNSESSIDSSVNDNSEVINSESDNNEPDTEETTSYETDLSSGYYTSGIDFPAGTYDIEAISGGGNVISDNAYSGGINAVMGSEDMNSVADIYEQKYSNIDLPEGTVLSISGGVVVKISSDNASGGALNSREQPNTQTIELENGNFVAGTDFPAGVYDIVAVEGSGNVISDNAYTGNGINAIMGTEDANSNTDIYEQEYKNIELPEGTTLEIDGVKINLVPSM